MYLAGNEGAPPREHLVRALSHAMRPSGAGSLRALDIGCGPGREALLLARAGYEVLAFDPYTEMLERTRALFAREPDGAALIERVALEHATLEQISQRLDPASFDLVHAGFVLPFVLPQRFDACFESLVRAMRQGAIFCGQFFGRDDEFIRSAAVGTMSCHGRADLERLFQPFEMLDIEEVNRQGRVGRGRDKWWHVFHVTARLV
jgi:SAM-dependent methyltransferase